MMQTAVRSTSLPFSVRRGKVRDVYDLGDQLLLVATDRLSAFDCVLPDPIPEKGRVLTALSEFWFEKLSGICKHHLVKVLQEAMPPKLEPFATEYADLERFLLSTGRHKLVVGLYRDLARSETGMALGRQIYAKARPGYHATIREAVERVLLL
jgi:phosphoribosylaminoimidazole-succinocarboxamide synthase